MPKKVHDRATHIMKKNPKMPEGEAWAIANQQLGKKKSSKKGKKKNG
jgi:hypothetical protein